MVGSNAFGFEEVEGVRKHGIDALPRARVERPRRPHRHAHPPVRARQLARRVHDHRHPGHDRRDQGRVRLPWLSHVSQLSRARRGRRSGRGDHAQPARGAQRAEPRGAQGAARRDRALRRRRRRRRDDPHRRRSRVLRRCRLEGVRVGRGAPGRGIRRGGGARDDGRTPFRGALPPHSKPLIGAVNGVAVTGGFEVALNCDFLIASDRARFADTHARVGVMPGWGLTVLLAQRIGIGARQGDEHHRQLRRRARPRSPGDS